MTAQISDTFLFRDEPFDLVAAIHMGFQDATSYRTVFDIPFTDGKIISSRDVSQEMVERRGAFRDRYDSVDSITGIDAAFSRKPDKDKNSE